MTHITIEKEKLESVLEALEANQPINYCLNNNGERFPMMQEDPFRFEANTKAITTIKEALAQPEEAQSALSLFQSGFIDGREKGLKEALAQPQRKPLTDEQAYEIGAKGGEPSEAERLLFEAWMRGHCGDVIGDWNGETYVHPQESTGFVHPRAMNTRQLWAAWRDRAALESAHGIKE